VTERSVAAESPLYNATIAARTDMTDSLAIFTVDPDGDHRAFVPGQYITVGLAADGRLIQRPYSVASSARRLGEGYELYVRRIRDGALTPLLFAAPASQRIALRGPKGRFTLQPGDDRIHLFVATGCGIAPFMSMLRTLLDDAAPRPTVLLHGVSHVSELTYRELLEKWALSRSWSFSYIPTISRPSDPANAGWRGRTGRVETIVADVCGSLGLTPASCVAYICGNPEMTANVETVLRGRGSAEQQIRTEEYWPLPR